MDQPNPKVVSFRDLVIWQKGMELVRMVYELTNKLPKEELFGLTSQIRRCAVSIPSNIAEGRGRSTRKDFTQFLHIAQGSLFELETQLTLIKDIYELDTSSIEKIITEEQKMLSSMIKKMQASPKT